MSSTVTQLIAAIVAAVVPVLVKLVNDWLEAQGKKTADKEEHHVE